MLLKPPFPFMENPVFRGFDVDILRSLLSRDYMIAVLMVRMGMYSIGVFKGEELLTAKAGTGLVHSRHKKGGSSQQRFARHREKQIETFFTRVCGHVREQIEPYLNSLDYVRYGGERITINSFRKQCQFVSKLDKYVIEALLSVREPKRATLQEAIEEVWSSRVIEWNEE
jgi:peptide subunit release factor 1 (eRF1)